MSFLSFHPDDTVVRRLSRALKTFRHACAGTDDDATDRVRPRLRRRFSLRCDRAGNWILTGALSDEFVQFTDLPAALSFARADADAGEADIELWVDGLYIFVHQAKGWPHPLCGMPAR